MKISLKEKIKTKIKSYNENEVFTASDFVDIADINTVWQTLARLENANEIKRIMNGVYYCPIYSDLLNEYEAPSPNHVANAIARKHGWTIAPSGNTALNQLGLSTQVSSKWSYISDGPYKKYKLHQIEIEFKHCSNKNISGLSYKTAMVIQAIKTLGKDGIEEHDIAKLKKILSLSEKEKMLIEAKKSTSWIYDYIKKICQ